MYIAGQQKAQTWPFGLTVNKYCSRSEQIRIVHKSLTSRLSLLLLRGSNSTNIMEGRVKSKNLFNFKPQGFIDKDIVAFDLKMKTEYDIDAVVIEERILKLSEEDFVAELRLKQFWLFHRQRLLTNDIVIMLLALAAALYEYVMMCHYIHLYPIHFFRFSLSPLQCIDAIDVTSVTLSRLNSIIAIDVIR